MEQRGERWLGWLDEWPALAGDFVGAHGTLLEILYTQSKNDSVHGSVVSVEAVGVGAFVIRQIRQEVGIVYADVEIEEGDPMLTVLECEEVEEQGEQEGRDGDDGDNEQAEGDDHRRSHVDQLEGHASGSFVPTHSTCTTRDIVVNMRTQYYQKDRWGPGHLFAFTLEVSNNTNERVRIMRRQWRVRAGGLQVDASLPHCSHCAH